MYSRRGRLPRVVSWRIFTSSKESRWAHEQTMDWQLGVRDMGLGWILPPCTCEMMYYIAGASWAMTAWLTDGETWHNKET